MGEPALESGVEGDQRGHSPGFPAPRTSFVGRDEDVARLERLFATPGCRLLTITGPGGVGKTRLALALAERPVFVERAEYVALADVGDPGLVPATILRRLGLEAVPDQPVADVLAASLRDRSALLVLDNLEHLPGAAETIVHLLELCPDLQILATSRIPLEIGGEQLYPLSPLALPEPGTASAAGAPAVQLFVDRVRLVLPMFQLTPGTLGDVVRICQQLDGLPLAIELAAAHCRQLAPHSLAERLSQRAVIAATGPRDAPRRQQTMQATVNWSVNLLDSHVAQLWRTLGVFEGGFTLESAEVIAGVVGVLPEDVAGMLDQLERHDLVRLGANANGEPRYHMLRITREVAATALQEDPRLADVLEARSGLYARFIAEVEAGLTGSDMMTWYNRAESELPNIRAAIGWDLERGELRRPMEMAARLHWFWTEPSYLREGLGLLSDLLARDDGEVPPAVRALALQVASTLAIWLGDTTAARGWATEALATWQETGDRVRMMETMLSLGNVSFDTADYVPAERWFRDGHALAIELQDAWHMPAFANLRALAAAAAGDLPAAAGWHRAALAGWRASGHENHVPIALTGLAGVLVTLGEDEEAVQCLLAVMPYISPAADTPSSNVFLLDCGMLAAQNGAPYPAIRLCAAAVRRHQEIGLQFRPHVVDRLDRVLGRLRARVGAAAFSRAWSEGSSLVTADAVAEASQYVAGLHERLSLTSREREVLQLMVEGTSDQDIADRLFITRRTASKHVASILEKLDAPNRTTAVTLAHRRGIVHDPGT